MFRKLLLLVCIIILTACAKTTDFPIVYLDNDPINSPLVSVKKIKIKLLVANDVVCGIQTEKCFNMKLTDNRKEMNVNLIKDFIIEYNVRNRTNYDTMIDITSKKRLNGLMAETGSGSYSLSGYMIETKKK